MIIITGNVQLDPARCREAARLGCEHAERSRLEPGCISHDCYLAADGTDRIHFFERWTDTHAVRAHFALPASKEFVRRLVQCAIAPPDIAIYSAEPVKVDTT